MEVRLQKLAASEVYRHSYTRRMLAWMGARLGTPSKFTELPREQEHIRWQMSVLNFDNAVWKAAFASDAELSHYIGDVARFNERLAETALIFSDEVPFWCKIGKQKVVFADW